MELRICLFSLVFFLLLASTASAAQIRAELRQKDAPRIRAKRWLGWGWPWRPWRPWRFWRPWGWPGPWGYGGYGGWGWG